MSHQVGKTAAELVESLRRSASEIRKGVELAASSAPTQDLAIRRGPSIEKMIKQAQTEALQQAADLEQAATLLEELTR